MTGSERGCAGRTGTATAARAGSVAWPPELRRWLVAGVAVLAGGASLPFETAAVTAAPPVPSASAHAAPPFAATAGPPGAAHAILHTRLLESEPSANDTLTEPPEQFRLLFSEDVNATLATLRLRLPDGSVTDVSPRSDPQDGRVVLATPPSLEPGAYRLAWRVVSADGHPVTGEIPFLFAPPDAEPDPDQPAVPPDEAEPPEVDPHDHEVEEEPFFEDHATPGLVALLRGIGVGLLLALGGLLLFQAWLATEPSRRVRRLVGLLAVVTPLVLLGHLIAWLAYFAPPGSTFNPTWVAYALSTETGRWELVRTGCAFFALWAATGKARRPGLAAALVLVGVLVSGAVGHPAVSDALWSVPAKSLHLVALSLWLGGVVWLVTAEKDAPTFLRNARRVSRASLVAVLLVAGTGIAMGFDFLTGVGDLFTTDYGRLYLGKVIGLGILVLFGARNRFQLLPRAEEAGAPPAELRRWLTMEVGVMVVVLLLAGFLAYVPPPGL